MQVRSEWKQDVEGWVGQPGSAVGVLERDKLDCGPFIYSASISKPRLCASSVQGTEMGKQQAEPSAYTLLLLPRGLILTRQMHGSKMYWSQLNLINVVTQPY